MPGVGGPSGRRILVFVVVDTSPIFGRGVAGPSGRHIFILHLGKEPPFEAGGGLDRRGATFWYYLQ